MGPRKPTTKSTTRSPTKRSAQNTIRTRRDKGGTPGKQIFRTFVFSFSGNFLEFRSGWSHEQMVKWIKYHGGAYDNAVTDETTHLICTIKDYARKTEQVNKASLQGALCCIITPEWLEDCLVNPKRIRALNEKRYTLDRAQKRVNLELKKQEQHRVDFGRGGKATYDLTGNSGYHVYYDDTGFVYEVVIVRFNEFGSTKCEKYTLYLLESNASHPKLYMSGAKYSRGPGHKVTFWRDECRAKVFKDAFADFKKFFHEKTAWHWDKRCDGLPYDPTNFRYELPPFSRPIGALPHGKKAPGFSEDKDAIGMDTEIASATETVVSDSDSGVEDSDSNTATSSEYRSFAVRDPGGPTSPLSISSGSGSE